MIFVSYRRDDTGLVAVDVARELADVVEAEVFLDVQSIGIGVRFGERIESALARAYVVVVLMGRGWAGEAQHQRRIDDEDDVFRREIEAALQSGATVIPVLVGDMPPLAATALPDSLQALLARQWHRLRQENKDASIRQLAEQVRDEVARQRLARLRAAAAEQRGGYRKIFDPPQFTRIAPSSAGGPAVPFVWAEDAVFRVNVALASDRVLIVAGPAGAGRETMAHAIAEQLGWRLYRYDATGSVSPHSLAYRVDETRRLADAQAGRLRHPGAYVEPGVAWWAFDAKSAWKRGMPDGEHDDLPMHDPDLALRTGSPDAVLQIADGDGAALTEHLRLVQGAGFAVPDAGLSVARQGRLLIVVTVADLRHVDRAQRLRAVVCQLRHPDREGLIRIGVLATGLDESLVARAVDGIAATQAALGQDAALEPRIVLDVLRAIKCLHIDPQADSAEWQALLDALLPG